MRTGTYPDVPASAEDVEGLLADLESIAQAVRKAHAEGDLTMGDVDAVHRHLDTVCDGLAIE